MAEPKGRQKHTRPVPSDEFERDLASLSPGELRKKYALEANSHKNMKTRCRTKGYRCAPEWEEFAGFLRSMGQKPKPDWSLDRYDPKDPVYGPGKCRWADAQTQTVNRTNTRTLIYLGEEMTITTFAERIGASYNTVYDALGRDEPPEQVAAKVACRLAKQAKGALATGAAAVWRLPDPTQHAQIDAEFREWKPKLRPWATKYGQLCVYYYLKTKAAFEQVTSALGTEVQRYDESPEIDRLRGLVSQFLERLADTLTFVQARDPALASELHGLTPAQCLTILRSGIDSSDEVASKKHSSRKTDNGGW